jgi:hypothetical protein
MAQEDVADGTASRAEAARTAPPRPGYVNQREVEREIMAGLPNHMPRMRDAYDCLRYAAARFEEYPTRHKDQRYRSPAVRRSLPIFKRIQEILTMHLYKSQPARKLADRVASQWLETVYRKNRMWARFKRADQLCLAGGFAGFQFAGSTDPLAPVKVNLWDASQVAYWTAADDATEVEAVATVDVRDNQRWLTLWTRDQIVTFRTVKGATHPGFGGTSYQLASFDDRPPRRPNPYVDRDGNGIIPFAFAHWEYPVSDFSTNSPGLNLKELNQGVNERLDNLGDSIYFNARPIGVAEGCDDGWAPPAEIRPGDFLKLPADNVDAAGNGPVPTLKFLMPDLQFVTKDWEDMSTFLDNTLEMWGVPPSMFRMVQTGAQSGIAIQSEQLPILGWVEGRRADWSSYEEDAARTCIAIGESHLRANGIDHDAGVLGAILDDWSFSLRWPSLYIQLPGPQRDQADDWRLSHSLVSLVGILQERQDLSEDEAFEHLAKVAEENRRLQQMGIPTSGFGMAPMGQLPGSPDLGPPPKPLGAPGEAASDPTGGQGGAPTDSGFTGDAPDIGGL